MENIIFTIVDEGGNGRLIGKKLSDEIGVHFYEKDIIKMASKNSNISEKIFNEVENTKISYFSCPFPPDFSFGLNIHFTPQFISIKDKIFVEKNKTVNGIAQKDSCVILCKGANYMLRNIKNTINVLIYESDDDLINKEKNIHKLGDKKAKKIVKKKNKCMQAYYNYYTGKNWDNKKTYDILINSSKISVSDSVKMLKELYISNNKKIKD